MTKIKFMKNKHYRITPFSNEKYMFNDDVSLLLRKTESMFSSIIVHYIDKLNTRHLATEITLNHVTSNTGENIYVIDVSYKMAFHQHLIVGLKAVWRIMLGIYILPLQCFPLLREISFSFRKFHFYSWGFLILRLQKT